jgi:hypothetical protein
MVGVPRWLGGPGKGRPHEHPLSPGGPDTDCFAPPPPQAPGLVVRALGGVCYLIPLLTFALCLAAMLFCLVSVVAGWFSG